MREDKSFLPGDLEVCDALTMRGLVGESVYVRAGGYLILRGMVGRDVIVEEGAQADLHGGVKGHVYNRGGLIRIYGIVRGHVYQGMGETIIDPKAVIYDETLFE